MSILRIKKISLAQKKPLRRPVTKKMRRFEMFGGPVRIALLSTPGTLAFRLGDWRGYYDMRNKWVDL